MKFRSLLALAVVAFALPTSAETPYQSGTGFSYFDPKVLIDDRFQYMSGGGSDRCEARDCICKTRAPKYRQSATPTIVHSRRLAVPFLEGSHSVNLSDGRSLSSFLSDFPTSTSFTIVSYTDGCGSHGYNSGLVQRRAATVKELMKKSGHTRVSLTQFKAEASRGHDPDSRRVDVIAHTSSRLTTMIEKIQADVYLIDASGSMWSGWKDWSNVIAVSFKPNSRIYMSQTFECTPGLRMDQVAPTGGTEIWYSYWKILELMKPGETLAIISDFRSDVPLTNREALIIQQKVEQHQIKVIAVSP